MPKYVIEIDAPDDVWSVKELDDIADGVYALLTQDVIPGADNISVSAKYN